LPGNVVKHLAVPFGQIGSVKDNRNTPLKKPADEDMDSLKEQAALAGAIGRLRKECFTEGISLKNDDGDFFGKTVGEIAFPGSRKSSKNNECWVGYWLRQRTQTINKKLYPGIYLTAAIYAS